MADPSFNQTAFSVAQVAIRWGVSSRHVYDLCARGELELPPVFLDSDLSNRRQSG